MDIDKIIQELNKRFAEPLPEFYPRRLIFWQDEDGKYMDNIAEITLDNAKIVILAANNIFAVKKLLHDDSDSNYLVYTTVTYDNENNWLFDMEIYSEKYYADWISSYIDEMGLPQTAEIRKIIKQYDKFFDAKDRRAKILAQNKMPSTPKQLHTAVMAAICGTKNPTPDSIMRCVLSAGLDNGENKLYADLVKYGADSIFKYMIRQGTGYDEEPFDLGRLAIHIMLTAAERTIHSDYLAQLKVFISTPHQPYCYDFISSWLHSDEIDKLYGIARFVENTVNLPKRFEKLDVSELVNTECFPCIHEVILTKILTDISRDLINPDIIVKIVEKRRTCVWYEQFECYYNGILQIANMQNFFKGYAAGFHLQSAKGIWNEYTDKYFKMDTYYRLFQKSFQKSLEESNILLDDLFKQAADKVEGLYTHWFLGQLGQNWTDVCADDLKEYGKILEIPHQKDFYNDKLKNADSRVFVIISDALRYEVAYELSEQLRRETQSEVKISGMQAVFPAITKFGMAALLPYNKLTAEINAATGKLSVLADGISTEMNYREKVLKKTEPESVVLDYGNLIKMKRTERQPLVKGKSIVYIYHDTIDETSHTSETDVFAACDKTIRELKNLIQIIVNDFSGANIIITADHGFLYTYSPLKEDSKVSADDFKGCAVEYGRRYAILKKGTAPKYLLPIKFLENDELEGYAPRESIRIKMSGGKLNFVHGGISLQELAVPLIEYHYLRNASKEYRTNKSKYDTKPVEVSLLSANRKITNMIFSLNFFQKDAVGDNRETATYRVYFIDQSGKIISDEQKIIADKASAEPQERTFRCSFNLKSLKYNNIEDYYLIIENTDDKDGINAQREKFRIDIAFAVDDFDFFS